MIRKTFVMAATAVLLVAPQVHANVVTYYLQDVNLDPWVLPYTGTPTSPHLMDLTGGSYYATVTINDYDGTGNVDFSVDINNDVSTGGFATPDPIGNFGIADFAFNTDVANFSDANIDVPPPAGWIPEVPPNMSSSVYGMFDANINDEMMPQRQEPLDFSIINVAGDTIASYVWPASGGVGGYFAVHVTGINTGIYVTDPNANEYNACDPTDPIYGPGGEFEGGCVLLQSAWFGGGTSEGGAPPDNIVPEPLSAALVGGALLGLVAIRRKMA